MPAKRLAIIKTYSSAAAFAALLLQSVPAFAQQTIDGVVSWPRSTCPPRCGFAPPLAPAERLFRLLQPEIQQGLVIISDGVEVVMRIREMFPSGSAVLNPRFTRMLERIGAALGEERGSVSVIGYTDNQPVHTLNFSSNFALSAARAMAAADLIGRTINDRSRLKVEGRADADPIASNATPQGRKENRRIEIVFHGLTAN